MDFQNGGSQVDIFGHQCLIDHGVFRDHLAEFIAILMIGEG